MPLLRTCQELSLAEPHGEVESECPLLDIQAPLHGVRMIRGVRVRTVCHPGTYLGLCSSPGRQVGPDSIRLALRSCRRLLSDASIRTNGGRLRTESSNA